MRSGYPMYGVMDGWKTETRPEIPLWLCGAGPRRGAGHHAKHRQCETGAVGFTEERAQAPGRRKGSNACGEPSRSMGGIPGRPGLKGGTSENS